MALSGPPEVPLNSITVQILSTTPYPQSDCPLYTKIPSEIRTRIFQFTLQEFEDKTKPFKADRLYYRPGCHYHMKNDTVLLKTCRLIYHETRLMPVTLREFPFWIHNAPPSYEQFGDTFDFWIRTRHLTHELRTSIQNVHIFVQQCYLELESKSAFSHIFDAPPACRKLRITLRHRDWWSWTSSVDSDDRLGISPWRPGRTTCQQMENEPLSKTMFWEEWKGGDLAVDPPFWGALFRRILGLEVLEMEMETDMRKKKQLDNVVEYAKQWRFPLVETRELRWIGEIRESSWVGLAELKAHSGWESDSDGDEDEDHEAEAPSQVGSDQLTETIADLTVSEKPAELMMAYHVVLMTWRAKDSSRKC